MNSNKFKYADLSQEDAKEKCKEIENDKNLSLQEKIDEFDRIGYGQTYDIIGLSYTLRNSNHFLIFPKKYNEYVTPYTFYSPTNKELPSIVTLYTSQYPPSYCLPSIIINKNEKFIKAAKK